MSERSTESLVIIILLNWNSLEDTLRCIDSIFTSTYPHFEIIVVDNGSDVNPEDTLDAAYPGVQVIRNSENRGFTGGNNQGIRLALEKNADYIWLLNNDTTVSPDTLRELVRAAETFPEAGLLSPVVYVQDHPEKVLWCGSYLDIELHQKHITKRLDEVSLWLERSPDKVGVWGTALFIRRSLIERIGLFDEHYFAYWEDNDYSIRSIQSGFLNQVVASARVFHQVKDRYPPHYYYYMVRNEYYFWMKYLERSQKPAFRRSYLARALQQAGELLKRDERLQAQACLAGIWDAWRHRFGEWNPDLHMPRLLARFLLAFPGFWIWMGEGNLHRIKVAISSRIRKR